MKQILKLQKLKNFIVLYCLFLSFSVYPVSTSISKNEVQVGEEVSLEFKFSPGEVEEWKIPEQGFFFSDEDKNLPQGEILSIGKQDGSINVKLKYFVPGKFTPPVEWREKGGEEKNTGIQIQVNSSLSGNEKEILDIESPVLFTGEYILRAVGVFFAAILLFAGLGYLFLYFNNKKSKVKDAFILKEHVAEDLNHYKNLLYELLLHEEIKHKDFIFILSGYIKEKISRKIDESVFHMTQSEINEILKNTFRMKDVEILTIENYFNSVKYMPNEALITRQNAQALVNQWEKNLR